MFASPAENTAYLFALRYLKFRPRSVKEIQDYLKKKQVSEETIKKIVDKLLEQKFLDDKAFAQSWVNSRKALKPLSQRVLSLELRQKGVSDEIIQEVLTKSANEQGSDIEMARVLVNKKVGRYRNMPKEEVYKKLGGFLSRRGFNYETIKKVLAELNL